jgi:tetratricopeptide (TPR) repeat protein
METRTQDFFVAGSALPPDSPSYIKRPADDELIKLLLAGQPCYVLAPLQVGKSSLMIRAASLLQKGQVSAAMIYLNEVSAEAGVEAWYRGLVTRLKLNLKLAVDPDAWWAERSSLKVTQRFIDFLHDVVLTEIDGPVIIFIDEIEAALRLDFAAGFLETLRSVYEARSTDPTYNRLTFVLLGAAVPADLIKDASRSPFTIAQKIDLPNFTREEVQLFQPSLEAIYPNRAAAILARIFYWTNSQPYLTQKLCLAVTEGDTERWANLSGDQLVDRLVEKLFLLESNQPDSNLLLVRDGLTNSPHRRRLLALYRQVYEGRAVAEEAASLDQERLKLLGLVRAEKGSLKVRNMIYRQVFNLNWLKANTASKFTRYIAVGLIVLALAVTVVMGFAIYNQFQHVIAAQAQPFLDSFNGTTDPNVRLTSLAGLFNLPGYEEEARRSFYQELNPEEQLALFEQTDPHAAGPELIRVIQGVYTAPDLGNNEAHNTLLRTMAQPLKQLVDDPSSPGAVSLELEITQWLKGREFYNQGDFRQAISAYKLAIDLNSQNPGILFDRGLAYAALDEPGLALADLTTVLQLDPNWQPRMQQALINDDKLYAAVWNEQDTYQDLVALVPTPTSTPIPTDTPIPTNTPAPTSTPTPRPPTATPTATATPTRAPVIPTSPASPVAPPTSSPSSDLPSGTLTLLAPLSLTEPSYGPTTFEWQWSGALPPEFGFEVRVWREGRPPAGVHNAVLDNQNGTVKNLGNNTYELKTDIKDAAGVLGNSGEYLWTVALVRISPKYRDLGQQAPPARLVFAAPGGSGGGGGSDGGGGVGID